MTCHSAQDQLQGASLRHPYSQGSFFFATVQSATEMSASHVPEPEIKDGPCLCCSTHEDSVPR